jgi:hypothetical protein
MEIFTIHSIHKLFLILNPLDINRDNKIGDNGAAFIGEGISNLLNLNTLNLNFR